MGNRTTRFVIGNGEVISRVVNKGLPQGGVISPTLYSIYTADITKEVRKDCKILQYADDIAIYKIDNNNRKETIEGIEEGITKVDENLNKLGLEIKPSKTNIIWFNRKGAEDQVQCNIRSEIIKSTNTAKFLGIVFDEESNLTDM